jgi:hypothetical protein
MISVRARVRGRCDTDQEGKEGENRQGGDPQEKRATESCFQPWFLLESRRINPRPARKVGYPTL